MKIGGVHAATAAFFAATLSPAWSSIAVAKEDALAKGDAALFRSDLRESRDGLRVGARAP